MRPKTNLLEIKSGYLTVVGEAPNNGVMVQWECQCICGKYVVKRATDIKRKRVISCGCKHGNRKYDRITSSASDIFRTNYSDSDMTLDRFMALTQRDCYYCGSKPSNNYTGQCGDVFIYNGLDRLDSSLPHLQTNCVPCCKLCNIMKWSLLPQDFINHIRLILKNIGDRY